jgi:hypothetical protein
MYINDIQRISNKMHAFSSCTATENHRSGNGICSLYGVKKQPMKEQTKKDVARILLGAGLVFAGISHLTFARKDFQAQVPDWASHSFFHIFSIVHFIVERNFLQSFLPCAVPAHQILNTYPQRDEEDLNYDRLVSPWIQSWRHHHKFL